MVIFTDRPVSVTMQNCDTSAPVPDVLGIISASIELSLELTYEPPTGKMTGRATLTIEVDVFMFSFSVSVSVERQFAGSNGDPTFEQVIGVLPDGTSPAWSQYCAAFAEE